MKPCSLCGKDHEILDCPHAILSPRRNWFIAEFNEPGIAGKAIEGMNKKINAPRGMMSDKVDMRPVIDELTSKFDDLSLIALLIITGILIDKLADKNVLNGEDITDLQDNILAALKYACRRDDD